MTKRSVGTVVILSIVTLFIYYLVWLVKTKNEMNKSGANIPTAWIWLIPFVGMIYWMWKYAGGVEHVTQGKMSQAVAFIILWLLGGPIAAAILQSTFNQAIDRGIPGQLPAARVA